MPLNSFGDLMRSSVKFIYTSLEKGNYNIPLILTQVALFIDIAPLWGVRERFFREKHVFKRIRPVR